MKDPQRLLVTLLVSFALDMLADPQTLGDPGAGELDTDNVLMFRQLDDLVRVEIDTRGRSGEVVDPTIRSELVVSAKGSR